VSLGNMLIMDESSLPACSAGEMAKPSKRRIADIRPIAPVVPRATLAFLRDSGDTIISKLFVNDISEREILSIEVFRMFTRVNHRRGSERAKSRQDSVASLNLKHSHRRLEVRCGRLWFAARRIRAWPR
jgi:hypothetical protein